MDHKTEKPQGLKNKLSRMSREECRQAAQVFLSGSMEDFARKHVDNIRAIIEGLPGNSLGKQFMVNAARSLKKVDYVAMMIELLMLDKVKADVGETLEYYNSWHARDKGLLPQAETPQDVAPYHSAISRRRMMTSAFGYALAGVMAAGAGAKILGSKELNEEYATEINSAIGASSLSYIALAADSFMNMDSYVADMVVKSVDRCLRGRASDVGSAAPTRG